VSERVVATAPVRVADVGGWTDTWFGSPGRVCHLAVGPGVEVTASWGEPSDGGAVHLVAPDVGLDRLVDPQRPAAAHPLLDHAVAAILDGVELPADRGIEARIASHVPPGASLGTSAAVLVALLGALDGLVSDVPRLPDDLAVLAHRVETVRAGREAGVQDHWAAAAGGAGLLAIGPYPEVRREPIAVPPRAIAELDDRLVTVVFGAHDSSLVHAQVINAMTGCGGAEHDRARHALRRLSSLAGDAAAALADGQVDPWAEVLVASTEAQRDLHAGLVGAAHQAAIDVAASLGAAGWKVNGAGGDGGSLTVVAGAGGADELGAAVAAVDPTWRVLRLRCADGLVVR
jgi:D-glycero-alpha-D-manno-heptose-7-phosphate kinase